jgi:hypothetical protein
MKLTGTRHLGQAVKITVIKTLDARTYSLYRAFKRGTSEALLRNKANRNGMIKERVLLFQR